MDMPVAYSGTEQVMTAMRGALWAPAGYNTTAPLYDLLRRLHAVRREALWASGSEVVIEAVNTSSLILSRASRSLFVFLHNHPGTKSSTLREYCLPNPLPSPPAGHAWYEALSGAIAALSADRRCLTAANSAPQLLTTRPVPTATARVWLAVGLTVLAMLILVTLTLTPRCVRRRGGARAIIRTALRDWRMRRHAGRARLHDPRSQLASPLGPDFGSSFGSFHSPGARSGVSLSEHGIAAVEISSSAVDRTRSFAATLSYQQMPDGR